ncbi:MAG: O-antigen ligase family protein [bacterium]
MLFDRKWLKTLGITGLLFSITATLLLSTRAFYLGIAVLVFVLIIFFFIRYRQTADKYFLRLMLLFLGIIVSGTVLFSVTQGYFYPKSKDTYNKNVMSRLSTISTAETSAGLRLGAWKWSWHAFNESPLLGVGIGNWKIVTIKEENLTAPDFSSRMVKAHNDFAEITTETGIFGGLSFLAIFLLTGLAFIKALFRRSTPQSIAILFLPAFGLLCYSFDAFFNFPQDRPEIQSLFALYVGMSVAFSAFYNQGQVSSPPEKSGRWSSKWMQSHFHKSGHATNGREAKTGLVFIRVFLGILYGTTLIFCSFILYENFTSLKLQRLIRDDIANGTFTHPADMFLNGFPAIPTIDIHGEPIASLKARYLINEQRNEEAIQLLKHDRSSPFDGRCEFHIAYAYNNQNNFDSSLVYLEKVYRMNPLFFLNISHLCDMYQKKGMGAKVEEMLDSYLYKVKTNKDAWSYTSTYYVNAGKLPEAVSVIDSASKYFPSDSLMIKQKMAIDRKSMVLPYMTLYNEAIEAYNSRKYDIASRYFSELLIKIPGFAEALEYRADCYLILKDYKKCILDIDLVISGGGNRSRLYNLRGICCQNLGNITEACENYKVASEMGDQDGSNNYAKLCKPGKK